VVSRPLISLGCDCHPAYVLRALSIRKQSFPFDWQNTDPSRGIEYVNSNIKTNFKFFTQELKRDDDNCIISAHYPYAQFLHYSDMIDNQTAVTTFLRRGKRFIEYFNRKKCLFLFNVPSYALGKSRDVSMVVDSVKEFHRLSNGRHKLFIYIRYDESYQENETNCNLLIERLNAIRHTRTAKYIRHKKEYGIWGDELQYVGLLKSLGINIRPSLIPKIYFSRQENV
jgi:hypothetical protein